MWWGAEGGDREEFGAESGFHGGEREGFHLDACVVTRSMAIARVVVNEMYRLICQHDCLSTFPQAVPLVHRVSMDVATLTLPTPNSHTCRK